MARAQRLSYQEARKERAISIFRQLIILVITVVIGVLVSVTVNAQSNSAKQTNSKKNVSTYKKYKVKNRAKANHYASAVAAPMEPASEHTPEIILVSTVDLGSQQAFIRQIVAQNLAERNSKEPFELSPLEFQLSGNRVTFKDINPFLFALEFALQGKAIIIDHQSITTGQENKEFSTQIASHVKEILSKMGAPSEKISLTSSSVAEENVLTISVL